MTEKDLLNFNRAQIKEINKYKWLESEKFGFDIGVKKAAFEWSNKFCDCFSEYFLEETHSNKNN